MYDSFLADEMKDGGRLENDVNCEKLGVFWAIVLCESFRELVMMGVDVGMSE